MQTKCLSKRKYFGTDGIRERAGEFPLVADFIRRLGFAVGGVLGDSTKRVLIGRDTRESGEWIFEALSQGFNAQGFAVDYLDIVPTPCLSLMTNNFAYSCGVIISASHNPYFDNGIKFFLGSGEKLSDDVELEIEKSLDNAELLDFKEPIFNKVDLKIFYSQLDLEGLKVALDCANGSFFYLAPKILKEFGAQIEAVAISPDGKNINADCGSTHINHLLSFMNNKDFHLGFAFDGDGDRVLAVQGNGKILDGDSILGILAIYLKEKGRLKNNTLVITVMSNLGLKLAMQEANINIIETNVGDRYVYEEMKNNDAVLGGEQSGHIILREFNNTGDGLLAVLMLLEVFKDWGQQKFYEISASIRKLPQVLINVRVDNKKAIEEVNTLSIACKRIEKKLAGKGRILIRYSGTEPVMRIMLEGENEEEIKQYAENFAKLVKQSL
ncbi:MAG: phosphoglucosamine mutase [bacterium]|nr:phosphoglucosamine mutase [bacterium]